MILDIGLLKGRVKELTHRCKTAVAFYPISPVGLPYRETILRGSVSMQWHALCGVCSITVLVMYISRAPKSLKQTQMCLNQIRWSKSSWID